MSKAKELFERRRARVRTQIRKKSIGRARLLVFGWSLHVYVQIIDDVNGDTRAAASKEDKEVRGKIKTGANIDAAKAVGKLIAERAVSKGIKEVVFDRGGYIYHGRVKALADAAREGGLAF